MKKINLLLLALLLPGGAAQATSWKMELEHKIYFAPDSRVTVQIQSIQASEEMWDRLLISLAYDPEQAAREAERIKAQNPGYQVQRVLLRQSGNQTLAIPALGVNEEVETKATVDGPYFHWETFVPKSESAKVRKALSQPETFLSVTGNVLATVPAEKLLERAVLPSTICSNLTSEGKDLFSVILAYPEVERKITEAAREQTNQMSLRDQVLRSCLALEKGAKIYSFADLLGLTVRQVTPTSDFVTELKRVVQEEKIIPLQFQIVKE